MMDGDSLCTHGPVMMVDETIDESTYPRHSPSSSRRGIESGDRAMRDACTIMRLGYLHYIGVGSMFVIPMNGSSEQKVREVGDIMRWVLGIQLEGSL